MEEGQSSRSVDAHGIGEADVNDRKWRKRVRRASLVGRFVVHPFIITALLVAVAVFDVFGLLPAWAAGSNLASSEQDATLAMCECALADDSVLVEADPDLLVAPVAVSEDMLSPLQFSASHRLLTSSSASSSSSASTSASSSDHDDHGSHPHEAMFFFIGSILVGTAIQHMISLPMFKGLQSTVLLFVFGILCSFLQEGLSLSDHLGALGRSYNMWMQIDPHLLLFTMIPPLVTGDAMTIDTSVAKRVAKQCLYMAGPGVLLNALMMAAFLYVYLPYDWSFMLCLTTGAILCATDPVAVVALLKELGASPTLTVQIQGESLLNDGTAIVLYVISYDILRGKEYDVGDVIQFLVRMAIYAWGLGMVIGIIFFLWIKAANNKLNHHSAVIQASLTICCAYSSFVISEGIFQISGVLSTVAAALVLAHKMWPYVVDKEFMHDLWHMLEYLGNTIIFFLAGALTGKTMIRIDFQDYVQLLVIYMAATFFRGTFLLGSRPLLGYLGEMKQEVSAADALVMTWGGLRGAIGLCLAIQVQLDKADGKISEVNADRVLFYVSGIATLTLMVNATTSPGLVKWLGITQLPAAKLKMLQVLNRQLLALSREKEHPVRVQEYICSMLEEVDHHIGGGHHHGSHSTKLTDDPFEADGHQPVEDDYDDEGPPDFLMVPLITPGATTAAMVSVMSGTKLHADLVQAKGKLATKNHGLLELLHDLPPMPLLDQEKHLDELSQKYMTDPHIQRAVNEAFLSLVRSQYWGMVEMNEFVSYVNEAEHLFTSITLAFSRPHYDLHDFSFIEPFIMASLEETQNRLSAVHSDTGVEMEEDADGAFWHPVRMFIHSIVESSVFSVIIAIAILANTLLVYIEQEVRDKDSGQQVSWLVVECLFQFIFTLECILKRIDQRVKYYYDGWNLFDFLLVIIGIVGLVMDVAADAILQQAGNVSGSEAQLVRIAQVFRIMRIIRLFRLIRFFRVLKAKFSRSDISLEVAEHMQKSTILACFVRAHIASQKLLVKYFGRDKRVDTVELARCILQSQLSCYKAMVLEIEQKQQLDPRILRAVAIAKEAKEISMQLEGFIVDAHESGVLSSTEAHLILHPIHASVLDFGRIIMDSQMGKVSRFVGDQRYEESDERRLSDESGEDIVDQIEHFRNDDGEPFVQREGSVWDGMDTPPAEAGTAKWPARGKSPASDHSPVGSPMGSPVSSPMGAPDTVDMGTDAPPRDPDEAPRDSADDHDESGGQNARGNEEGAKKKLRKKAKFKKATVATPGQEKAVAAHEQLPSPPPEPPRGVDSEGSAAAPITTDSTSDRGSKDSWGSLAGFARPATGEGAVEGEEPFPEPHAAQEILQQGARRQPAELTTPVGELLDDAAPALPVEQSATEPAARPPPQPPDSGQLPMTSHGTILD